STSSRGCQPQDGRSMDPRSPARAPAPRAAARLSFRWQLVLAAVGLVLVTLLLMLVPAYLSTRAQVTNAYRERLSALALGAGVARHGAPVDSLAAEPGRQTQAYLGAGMALRGFVPSSSDSAGSGLSLVLPSRDGAWRVLVRSGWSSEPPARPEAWAPPAGLA